MWPIQRTIIQERRGKATRSQKPSLCLSCSNHSHMLAHTCITWSPSLAIHKAWEQLRLISGHQKMTQQKKTLTTRCEMHAGKKGFEMLVREGWRVKRHFSKPCFCSNFILHTNHMQYIITSNWKVGNSHIWKARTKKYFCLKNGKAVLVVKVVVWTNRWTDKSFQCSDTYRWG